MDGSTGQVLSWDCKYFLFSGIRIIDPGPKKTFVILDFSPRKGEMIAIPESFAV